jgi:hypothetical protein
MQAPHPNSIMTREEVANWLTRHSYGPVEP